MLYNVTHKTVYRYGGMVPLAHHLLRLRPRDHSRQHCHACEIVIDPPASVCAEHEDSYGNHSTFVTVEGGHTALTITVQSRVEVIAGPQTPLDASLPWEEARRRLEKKPSADGLAATEFLFDSPLVDAATMYAEYAAPCFPAGRPLMKAAMELTQQIYRDFQFDPQATTIATPVNEVFSKRRGVCQDFAHLEIACLRSLGVPARYVSGYLETDPPPGRPRLAGADASHAWIAVYCEGTGWVDFDPTNNMACSTRHITTAWGRDYGDVSPIRGVIIGCGEHSLRVAVDVIPVE